MSEIEYLCFNKVNLEYLLEIVNEDTLRKHLIDHHPFDSASLQAWMENKISIDKKQGCRVRAVYIGGVLAGWRGIKPDDKGFEIAIVISKKFWGFGLLIFKTHMRWANELGHKEIVFHLLDSRPEYKALNKMSTRVHKTELAGRCFTT
ncbi:hypothetical protein [Candidatus Thiodiazotropha sp. CDECU1]|uniref:hypothetical protein n=1 Tax=Candidatus Thiodiazotropha sp. CDECU1 TaxID=3065865 RepID=UPI002931AEDE|nr:hypothetical protein [Candidatus Thiodiazotropha sp. CDECU1]